MPTYEYACSSCHHEWEAEQSIKAAPLTECPTCHEHAARRQISRGGGFILKGGGWYSDLYSSASNKPASPSKSESESGSSADQGKKSESGDKKSESGGSSVGASSSVAASSSATAA